MKNIKIAKKLTSLLTAATIVVTANASVAAEAITETQQLTDIHGYACYERDGSYWTMLEGEEYLVIDLDSLVTTDTEDNVEDIEASPCSAQSGDSPIGLPTSDWYDCGYVDLEANGGSYVSGIYISSGNCDSPIYTFNKEKKVYKETIAKITTLNDFSYENHYIIDVWVHSGGTGISAEWRLVADKKEFVFKILNGHVNVLFSGTADRIIDGFALRFYKRSTGVKTQLYEVSVKMKN